MKGIRKLLATQELNLTCNVMMTFLTHEFKCTAWMDLLYVTRSLRPGHINSPYLTGFEKTRLPHTIREGKQMLA